MNVSHNWMNQPVTARRYHLLARLHVRGLLTNEWREAIMTGALDTYELL